MLEEEEEFDEPVVLDNGKYASMPHTNPLLELDTTIAPLEGVPVYDEVPVGLSSGYEAMNPEWLDQQHALMADEPWFREKDITTFGALKLLMPKAMGAFIVRVVSKVFPSR